MSWMDVSSVAVFNADIFVAKVALFFKFLTISQTSLPSTGLRKIEFVTSFFINSFGLFMHAEFVVEISDFSFVAISLKYVLKFSAMKVIRIVFFFRFCGVFFDEFLHFSVFLVIFFCRMFYELVIQSILACACIFQPRKYPRFGVRSFIFTAISVGF